MSKESFDNNPLTKIDQLVGFSVQEIVAKHYGDLPYHNFDHALEIVRQSQDLITKCRQYDLEVDELVVILAALFHDAGYDKDHQELGFDSKEELSAHLAEQELKQKDIARDTITAVKDCILATHRQSDFTTVEQKILRAADLAGLAGSYDDFLANAELLKQEFAQLNNHQLTDHQWKQMTSQLIEFYLSQDIKLTPEHDDADGQSIFHVKVKANLARFLAS